MRSLTSLGWQLALPVIAASAACVGAAGDRSDASGSNVSGGGATTLPSPIAAAEAKASFTAFESGPVRPMALSPSGKLLFVANTPDDRLEVLRVTKNGLQAIGSVPVGLEPVAVAARSDTEVWVVNHLSDSVSIVSVAVSATVGVDVRVRRTLLVGDEPRDIVFAGPNKSRAFITTAHRGQNVGFDPQLTTPGIGRADVWVFDATNPGDGLGGTPMSIVNLFTDTPRALAVSPDGNTVYAAGFASGNQTTTIHERIVTNNGGSPPPSQNAGGYTAPPTGLIVKYRVDPADGQKHWMDELNRHWDAQVMFDLPDKDVFAIDAAASPPALRTGVGAAYTGVGTTLFNMAVNPISGKIYVSNTESRNHVRFEGHNAFAGTGSVRGHIAESRITVLDGATATPHHLNKHIDYSKDGTPDEAAKSVAFPLDMAVTKDGSTLFVCAFGSSAVAVYDTAQLESDAFVPSTTNQIALTGGGPAGVVLDEANGALYVLTRFDDAISVVSTSTKQEIAHLPLFNPEPASVVAGRRFLYDARHTSSHGDSACASCHTFADDDALAWDLGDPDGSAAPVPGPFAVPLLSFFPPQVSTSMKGPMTTQSLRGLANHGSLHWRGDRTTANDPGVVSAQPNSGAFDEVGAFKKFNVAFPGLNGAAAQISDADMQTFADFVMQITYPPNPIRNLDNTLTPDQAAGRAFYFNHLTNADGTTQEIPVDTFRSCNGCHVLDPQGNAQYGVAKPGFFGTDGHWSFEDEAQYMKVPHLRSAYQKVGMFGMANTWRLPIDSSAAPLLSFLPAPLDDNSFQGDQVRGFGFTHDGAVDTLFRFVGANVFVQRPATDPFPNPGGIPATADGVKLRRQLEAFLLAYDSNLAPIVGQQVTLSATNGAAASARVTLFEQRAVAGECDVVVHGQYGTGWLYVPASGAFATNHTGDPLLSDAALRALASTVDLTFTCAPSGSGVRMALDRNLDGVLDGD